MEIKSMFVIAEKLDELEAKNLELEAQITSLEYQLCEKKEGFMEFDKWWELVSLDSETTKEHAREYYKLATQELEAKLAVAVEALNYTQRTDVKIGHTELTEDGIWRDMPDKIMMRNRCKQALAAIKGEH